LVVERDEEVVEALPEREFFIDNLLVRIHFIIVVIRWIGLAPWKVEFPFPGSLTSTFLVERDEEVVEALPDQGEDVHRNVQRFRGGLVFKAHRLCVSLNTRLESNKEEALPDQGEDVIQ